MCVRDEDRETGKKEGDGKGRDMIPIASGIRAEAVGRNARVMAVPRLGLWIPLPCRVPTDEG